MGGLANHVFAARHAHLITLVSPGHQTMTRLLKPLVAVAEHTVRSVLQSLIMLLSATHDRGHNNVCDRLEKMLGMRCKLFYQTGFGLLTAAQKISTCTAVLASRHVVAVLLQRRRQASVLVDCFVTLWAISAASQGSAETTVKSRVSTNVPSCASPFARIGQFYSRTQDAFSWCVASPQAFVGHVDVTCIGSDHCVIGSITVEAEGLAPNSYHVFDLQNTSAA